MYDPCFLGAIRHILDPSSTGEDWDSATSVSMMIDTSSESMICVYDFLVFIMNQLELQCKSMSQIYLFHTL